MRAVSMKQAVMVPPTLWAALTWRQNELRLPVEFNVDFRPTLSVC
jgi:hypothetical protein